MQKEKKRTMNEERGMYNKWKKIIKEKLVFVVCIYLQIIFINNIYK